MKDPRKRPDAFAVAAAIDAVPKTFDHDELVAFLLTVVVQRVPDPRAALPLILSMALTYCRIHGIGFDTLAQMLELAAADVRDVKTAEEARKWRSN